MKRPVLAVLVPDITPEEDYYFITLYRKRNYVIEFPNDSLQDKWKFQEKYTQKRIEIQALNWLKALEKRKDKVILYVRGNEKIFEALKSASKNVKVINNLEVLL